MKKYISSLLLLLCTACYGYAQLPTRPVPTKKMVKPLDIPSQPSTTPTTPAAPTAPPPAPAPAPIYSLSGVSVKIKTGADNKESLSTVLLNLYNTSTNVLCFQHPQTINAQFDSNSEMQFRLVRFSMQGRPDNAPSLLLNSIQNNGLRFDIGYSPNFIFDAWKVQGVTLVLEFSDQFGKPHPSLSSVPIQISNAVGMLDGTNNKMSCYIDKNFRSLNSTIGRF